MKNVQGITPNVAAGDHYAYDYSLIDGDSYMTMTIPATSTGIIAVGSWIDEKPLASGLSEWTSVNGNTYDQTNINSPGGSGSTLNDLSSFSSLGPTADGRNKPEVIAPGEPILSTLASDAYVSESLKVDDAHFKEVGTSMASPFITGTVALLLQRNNCLTFSEVKTAIAQGAFTTGLSSKTLNPLDSYGAGKVSALGAVGSVLENTSCYSGTGDVPIDSSSTCTLVRGANNDAGILAMMFAALTILAARAFRKVTANR